MGSQKGFIPVKVRISGVKSLLNFISYMGLKSHAPLPTGLRRMKSMVVTEEVALPDPAKV